MSNRQNDRFARPSDSLSISLTAMCTIKELFRRTFFANGPIFELDIQNDRQNDQFARPSHSLSNSLSTMCTS